MKLRINEDQLNMLQNLQKGSEFDKTIQQMKDMVGIVNKYHNKLTFVDVVGAMAGEVDLHKIFNELHDLHNKAHELGKLAYEMIANSPDEENLDEKIDDTQSFVQGKIELLLDLVEHLTSIKELNYEDNFTKHFIDNKPIKA